MQYYSILYLTDDLLVISIYGASDEIKVLWQIFLGDKQLLLLFSKDVRQSKIVSWCGN